MLDNKLVQIALGLVALYVIMQIMNNGVSQENMDTIVNITPEQNGFPDVSVQQAKNSNTSVSVTNQNPFETVVNISPALSTSVPAGVNSLFTPELNGTSNASAKAVVTAAPSAALNTGKQPSALTSVEETLLAAAPKPIAGEMAASPDMGNVFAAEPTDLESLFGRRGAMNPADLIVKNQDAELYGGIQPDPKMNQNFLMNRFSMGIDVSKPKKGTIVNDLRGAPPPPAIMSAIWNAPTVMPDLYRKSLADVC